ncbi:hypothetical protein [Pleurocapsa sp. PCC 7319]|uniref:hypothetical protein n=1 Tax=Pleurocapsa sp. PCC 7319 TaxID=118161 RepID=UPI000477D805|nr:hypothetical protein [Pleurocapsa sp. PCC 7319]
MTETIASDECYVCDGIFKKSDENNDIVKSKVKCNTLDEGQESKNDSVEEFSILPSPTSQKEVESYINQSVTDS